MSDDDFKILSRLMALELLMIERLTSEYLKTADPAQAAAKHRETLRDVLSAISVDGLDAALSDLAVGEVGGAVDRIVEEAGRSATQKAGERKRP